jgi:phosphoglycolate phosphatase-like HAD superfamily hydrolase
MLDTWAAAGVGDWRASLERFASERAPVYFRPDATTGAALRRLAASATTVGAFTDAPTELAAVAASQLGATRRLEALVCGRDAEARLIAELGGTATIIRSRTELASSA